MSLGCGVRGPGKVPSDKLDNASNSNLTQNSIQDGSSWRSLFAVANNAYMKPVQYICNGLKISIGCHITTKLHSFLYMHPCDRHGHRPQPFKACKPYHTSEPAEVRPEALTMLPISESERIVLRVSRRVLIVPA
ncbi:hypothetical protein AFCA_004936 [Aspergillus flavus]|nr:hypothetical protein AFCA_004936 [Aspergillus flavus]